jgi:hypothetical protein
MYRAVRVLFATIIVALNVAHAAAQSQAINGTIEGTITDQSGAALPGVSVTVANIDTGDTRVVVSNEAGVYRAPLLPLGRYRVSAELEGFRKFEQLGLTLSAGQAAVININMTVGNVSEAITVTSESAVAEPGKIDLGRTIGET